MTDHLKLREAIEYALEATVRGGCGFIATPLKAVSLPPLVHSIPEDQDGTRGGVVEYAEKHLGLGTWSPRVKALQNSSRGFAVILLLGLIEEIFAVLYCTGPHQQEDPE